MSEAVDVFRERIKRRAIVMEIGGFQPSESPFTSWFGHAAFALPGELWPQANGRPMLALCQLNVSELPFRPPRFEDFEFITVFIDRDEFPDQNANWCLRAYKDLSQLIPLDNPVTDSPINALPMRPTIVEADFPCHEDIPCEVPEEVDERYYDHFANVSGFKLGGWPTLIQSEIYWAPWNQHPISPEYVFQIDSTEEGNWIWGDNGVAYFGRGTVDNHRHEWACEWQCY